MKNLTLIMLLIFPLPVVGQNHFLGLKGGVNWTNATSTFLVDNNNRTGFSGGLTYEYRLKKHFIIGADLLYLQNGFTNDITFTDKNGNPIGEKGRSDFNYDYISFPLKGGFIMGNRIEGFVNLGIVPSILIDAKTVVPTFDGHETFNVTDRVTKFDFGGLIEIGGNFKFNDRLFLLTSLTYQHSFTTLTNPDYFADDKITLYGMTLSIGLKYALAKE